MCDSCDWEDFVVRAEGLVDSLEDLPDRAEDFADGVRDTAEGMIETARENKHVTERMESALNNMQDGVARWLE
jgi:hypothetical protein